MSVLIAFGPVTGSRARESSIQEDRARTALPARAETLWIFDADFEDAQGCNAGIEDLGGVGDSLTGWYTFDYSPFPSQPAYWHRDSYHAYPDGSPPDTSFWCGTFNVCFEQTGYGNLWRQYLCRDFELTPYGGQSLSLEFRQKLALEGEYDFGYVEVAVLDGPSPDSYTTLYTICNPNFLNPGIPQDWDSNSTGEVQLDLSGYAGHMVRLRWRVQSDGLWSSEDVTASQMWGNSVTDGAWYIDEVRVFADGVPVFYADFEDPSEPDNREWVVASGQGDQVGVVWRLVQSPAAGMAAGRGARAVVANDSTLNQLADGQKAHLRTPIIGVPSSELVLVELQGYVDMPTSGPPYTRLSVSANTGPDSECVNALHEFSNVLWLDDDQNGPGIWTETFTMPDGHGVVALNLELYGGPHGTDSEGVYVDRLRLGAINAATSVPGEPGVSGASLSVDVAQNPVPPGMPVGLSGSTSAHDPIRIRIFDVSGRVVATDVVVPNQDGTWSYKWHAAAPPRKRIAAGVYFAEVQTAQSALVRKIVILK